MEKRLTPMRHSLYIEIQKDFAPHIVNTANRIT